MSIRLALDENQVLGQCGSLLVDDVFQRRVELCKGRSVLWALFPAGTHQRVSVR